MQVVDNCQDINCIYTNSSVGGGNRKRNSSVELFRILATFLVLIVHLNGWMAGGLVEWNNGDIPMVHKVSQLIIQSLCVVCVNCFLVISGWFGLKLKFASLWKMWVLLVSIYVPFYLASCIFGKTDFSIIYFAKIMLAFPCESYFVQNYIMLMFISPVLNAFIEYKKEYLTLFSISLFVIEVLMESIFHNKCLYIEEGYSLFHFVMMYMLARTAFIHKEKIMSVKKQWWILGYFICATVVCLLHFTPYEHNWAYSNPVVIIESFMLFFPFLYCSFQNRIVNWIAGGTFAVYIIQVTSPVTGLLFKYDQYAVENLPYTFYLPLMILFSFAFFACSLMYNEIMQRILRVLTNPLGQYLNCKINKLINTTNNIQ